MPPFFHAAVTILILRHFSKSTTVPDDLSGLI
jgi:hypothetical protein